MTIALVEIGTRSVRLLVAARSDKGGIRIIATGVEQSPFGNTLPSPGSDAFPATRVNNLCSIIEKLVASASGYSNTEVFVFGTESLRRLRDVEINAIRNRVPGLRVLSAEEEARACHASACLVAHMQGLSADTIISGDIGSGSFELCAGGLDTPGTCTWYVGTGLGSNRLRELYLIGGLAEVERAVAASFVKTLFRYAPKEEALLFFSGSAATKFAWLIYRASIGDDIGIPYDMKKIQGTVIAQADVVENLAMLDRFRTKDRDSAARLVSPENPGGPEIEILISGIQVIRSTLEHTRQTRVLVNAYGGRHGIAWLRLRGFEL